MWLWWYDRGGAVQSHGLDIIANLPHLVVLLAILRHFGDEAWGLNPAFTAITDPEGKKRWAFDLQGHSFTVQQADDRPLYLSLFSRGSSVVRVKSMSDYPFPPKTALNDQEMVAKIYHPEAARTSEVELLGLAYAVAAGGDEDAYHVRGHLPALVASSSWDDVYAKSFESILQVNDRKKRISRCLRILVFHKLYPITELTGESFVRVWVECFRCT